MYIYCILMCLRVICNCVGCYLLRAVFCIIISVIVNISLHIRGPFAPWTCCDNDGYFGHFTFLSGLSLCLLRSIFPGALSMEMGGSWCGTSCPPLLCFFLFLAPSGVDFSLPFLVREPYAGPALISGLGIYPDALVSASGERREACSWVEWGMPPRWWVLGCWGLRVLVSWRPPALCYSGVLAPLSWESSCSWIFS